MATHLPDIDTTTTVVSLELTYWELYMIRKALSRARMGWLRDLERQAITGWAPEPGKMNLAAVNLGHLAAVWPQLPDPDVVEWKGEES